MEEKNLVLSNILLLFNMKCKEEPSYCNIILFVDFVNDLKNSDFIHIKEPITLCFKSILKMLMDNKLCEKSLEILLISLNKIIENKSIQLNAHELIEFINLYSFLLTTPTQTSIKLKNSAEESKLLILSSVHIIFYNTPISTINTLYEVNNLPLFGHLVTLCLLILEKEAFRKLKIMSLICLQDIFCVSDRQKDFTDFDLNIICSIMVSFLPGVSIRLIKYLMTLTNEGINITCFVIETFYKIVGLLFADKYIFLTTFESNFGCNKGVSDKYDVKSLKVEDFVSNKSNAVNQNRLTESDGSKTDNFTRNNIKSSNTEISELLVVRDKDWVISTDEKFNILLKNFDVFLSLNQCSKIQITVLQLCEYLLTNSFRSLKLSNELLLNILLQAFVSDEFDISSTSATILQKLKSSDHNNSNSFGNMIVNSMYSLLENFPIYFASSEHEKQVKYLKLLRSHLTLYRDVDQFLCGNNGHFAASIFNQFLPLIKFNMAFISLIENYNIDLSFFKQLNTNCNSWKDYGSNLDVLNQIAIILSLFGCHGDLHQMVTFIRSQMVSMEIQLFCLARLLEGFSLRFSIQDFECNLLKTLAQDLIASENFNLPCSFNSLNIESDYPNLKLKLVPILHSYSKMDNILKIRKNILMVSLTLDALASISNAIKTDLAPFFSLCLYPVLEKIGSENVFLSQIAFITLAKFQNSSKKITSLQDNYVQLDLTENSNHLNIDSNNEKNDSLVNNLMDKNDSYSIVLKEVKSLLDENMDYLFCSILLRLKRIARHPTVLIVLKVIIIIGRENAMQFLYTIFPQILATLDLHHLQKPLEFALLFNTILDQLYIQCSNDPHILKSEINNLNKKTSEINNLIYSDQNINIVKQSSNLSKSFENKDIYMLLNDKITNWDLDEQINKLLRIKPINNQEFSEQVSEYILNLHSECVKNINDDDEDNNDDNDERINTNDGSTSCDDNLESRYEDVKKILPTEINVVMKILDRCQHLLISSEPKVKMLILELILKSSLILKPFQTEYLPLLHKVWKPFVSRFSDKEFYISIKAIEVLKVMCETAGDFVKRRIGEDVLPQILTSLNTNVYISLNKPNSYSFTSNCQFQKALLSNIGKLCLYSEIRGKELNNVCIACSKYLDSKQPLCLQTSAVQCFEDLIKLDYSIVWLHVHFLQKL